MQVQDIMTKNPACCVPETDVSTIARLMCTNECGSIPVVRDMTSRYLIGIVTGRDLTCHVLAKGENPNNVIAQDCLTAPVVTIAPEASVEECCKAMEHARIRRILVVDANGACCGIVSLDDIAYWAPNQTTATLIRAVMHPPKSASLSGILP
jgi:CBS domain-containing protein